MYVVDIFHAIQYNMDTKSAITIPPDSGGAATRRGEADSQPCRAFFADKRLHGERKCREYAYTASISAAMEGYPCKITEKFR